MQQNDAFYQHSWVFGLDGTVKFLQSFSISLCINCGAMFWKVNEQWPLTVKEKGHHDFPRADIHGLKFFSAGVNSCFHS